MPVDAGAALASATILTANSVAAPFSVTGSALRPAGNPLILMVTGPSNAPLRTIFPLT